MRHRRRHFGNNPTHLHQIKEQTQKTKHFNPQPQSKEKMRSIEEIIDEIKREHEEDLARGKETPETKEPHI